jgi:hypothetical protein
MQRYELVQALRKRGLSQQRANDLIDDIADGIVSDMALLEFMRGNRQMVAVLKKAAFSIAHSERYKSDLDDFFGPQPIDTDLIRSALRGAVAVMVHLSKGRVTKLDRGARQDRRLPPSAEEHVLRAFQEKGYNFLVGLLPKVGRSSAQLRVIR